MCKILCNLITCNFFNFGEMKDEASIACDDRHTKEELIHLIETWQIDNLGIRVKLNELKNIKF